MAFTKESKKPESGGMNIEPVDFQSHCTPWSARGSHRHSPQRGRPMDTAPQSLGRLGQRDSGPETGTGKAYFTLGPRSHLLKYLVSQDG